MSIDKNLVKRYLNCNENDNEIDRKIEEVFAELLVISNPKKLCVLSNAIKNQNGYYFLEKLGLELKSEDINNLFCDCSQIATLVVTLGFEVDRRIAFYAKCDLERSLILDAVANVYVESVLDELEEQTCRQLPELFKTMRFSAGYGDLDISVQKDLIERTGADKFVGISVNESYLMTPLKSITAFIGFSNKRQVFGNICLTCPQKGKCKTKCSRAND